MQKVVILFTISVLSWMLAGPVMAQGNRHGGPVANGLLMSVPAIAPLNRPVTVAAAHAHGPKLTEATAGPRRTGHDMLVGNPGQGNLGQGNPGQGNPGQVKAAEKKSAALEREEMAATAHEPRRVIPTCH